MIVGDDVCNMNIVNTSADMTTPEVFKENVLYAMNYLNENVLPAGSHVVFIGLVDGRILFNALHDKIHPVFRFDCHKFIK